LVQCNTNELDNETLVNIKEQWAYEEWEDNLDNGEYAELHLHDLTAEKLSKIIGIVEQVSDHIMKCDPNIERGITIYWTMNSAICCYKDLYVEKTPKEKCRNQYSSFFQKKNVKKWIIK